MTFAWFTSKDEVTNRLTANSDYGVSIVESFTPPKNWIPGQEINKDVYAVNTGSIDAFVKEDVSGVLTFTYESLVDNFSDKCVTLSKTVKTSIDGVTTEEAGGFLAWTSANYPTGSIASARTEDVESGDATEQWTPPAAGDYIFRRAIDVNSETGVETYTYAGYHYEPAKGTEGEEGYVPATYYKIVIGTDLYPTNTAGGSEYDISAEQTALGVNASVGKDGVITGTPDIHYVVASEVKAKPTKFSLVQPGGDDNDYLEVVYANGSGAQSQLADLEATRDAAQKAYDDAVLASTTAGTDLAQKEADLRNAEGAYNSAKSRYDQTKADYDYANALATATNKLVDQAVATANAHSAFDNAIDALKQAAMDLNSGADAQNTALTNLKNALGTDGTNNAGSTNLAPHKLIPDNVRTYINNNGATAGASDLTNAKSNMDQFDQLWNDIQADITALQSAYTSIKAIENAAGSSNATNPDDVNAQYEIIKTQITKLKNDLANYVAAYAHFADSLIDPATTPAFPEDLLSGLENVASTADFSGVTAAVNSMVVYVQVNLKELVEDYEEAYDNMVAAETAMTTEDGKWTTAVTTYNTTVADAKTIYTGNNGVGATQTLPNNFPLSTGNKLTDNGGTLVPGAFANPSSGAGYSAVAEAADSKTESDGDPEIKPGTSYTKYATVDSGAGHAVTRLLTRGIADEDDFTQLSANYANTETPADATEPQKLSELAAKLEAADTAKKTANGAFETAKTNKTNAETAVTAAEGVLNAAKQAVTDFGDGSPNTIKLRVNLDKDYASYWEMDPDTNNTENVDFYLKKILTAGETSHKLIDSVEMDSSMTSKSYKDLTFDLNVALDSVQVTYDADQRGYTTETVDANINFAGMKAKVDNPLTEGSTVTWTDVSGVIGGNSVANVKIDDKSVTTLTKDSTLQLSASVDKGATDKTIVWRSSDTNVASVDENGLVTGISSGTATITVTATNGTEDTSDDRTDTITISVSNPATGLVLDKSNADLPLNETLTLMPTITPPDADGAVTWSTDNPAVATVANGVVTPVSKGTATITATIGDQTATCEVNVTGIVETLVIANCNAVASGAFIDGEFSHVNHSMNTVDGVSIVYTPGEGEPSVVGTYYEGLSMGSWVQPTWGRVDIVADEGLITKIEIDGRVVWDGPPSNSIPYTFGNIFNKTIKFTVQK